MFHTTAQQVHVRHPSALRQWKVSLCARTIFAMLLFLLLMSPLANAQPADESPASAASTDSRDSGTPLYEREPFDRLFLQDGSTLEVEPIDVPGRRMPTEIRPAETIEVRILDSREILYRVAWGDVARIEFFEQMLLDVAARLVDAGDFDTAFEYYRFLVRNYPNYHGLSAALDAFLYREAQSHLSAGRNQRAFALLLELAGRNAMHPGLEQAFGQVIEPLIEAYVAEQQFLDARRLMNQLQTRYPRHAVVQRWTQRLGGTSAEHLTQARAAFDGGRLHEAHDEVRTALDYWPSTPGARELFEQVYQKYPYVTIGVSAPASQTIASTLYSWGERRVSRLSHRSLMELTGYGAEGGIYRSPFGTLELVDFGLGASLRLREGSYWSDGRTQLDGYHISRLLIDAVDRQNPRYEPLLADLLRSIDVRDVYEVDLRFRYSHVHPATLLEQTLRIARPGIGQTQELSCGPFERANQSSETLVTFSRRTVGDQASSGQLQEIMERHFPLLSASVEALNRGEIAAVDRVNPWELSQVTQSPGLRLGRYALPTVHCLIPNPYKRATANRTFRRALLYAIDREAILLQGLWRGENPHGSRVISVPFVRGTSFDDPRGYGYDETTEPRRFDPKLALTLISVALKELSSSETQNGHDGAMAGSPESADDTIPAANSPSTTLTLAHFPGEIATRACTAIASYLEPLGIAVQLVELPVDTSVEQARQYDLWYVELAAWEPVIDAHRLFGRGGPAATDSPYMELALRRLAEAADWRAARQQLLNLDRLVNEELPVLPLWQLTDHFAYHERLVGIGDTPVKLYQNVEQWQVAPWFPSDAN